MQKADKKKSPVQEPEKDSQRYQLKIEQIRLLKKIDGKASLIIKDEQNIILKQIPFQTHQKQVVDVLLDIGICCPKFCFVVHLDGHYYDQELGSIQVNKDHNACYIYADKYPNQRGCYVKYKLENSRKRNHFDNNAVIFDEYLKNQAKYRNKRSRDIVNVSRQKQQMYEPTNKIVELSEQQNDDSVEQINYNQSYDERNITIMKKVKQASQILDKSLQKSEDEKKIFSKYLDESTSFINELLGQLNTSKDTLSRLDVSAIKQSNDSVDEFTTQQKWYKNKFNKIHPKGRKKRAKILKVIKTGKQTESKVDLVMSNEGLQSARKKQISEIIISSTEKPTQINLFVEDKAIKKLRKLAKMVKQNGEPSSAWPVKLIINNQYSPIYVSCIVCKQEYVGLIGKEEEKIGQCELFNKQGESQGYLYFKCKQLCQSVAQTQDFIYLKQESVLTVHSHKNTVKDIQQISKIGEENNENAFTTPIKRSPDRILEKTKQTEQQSEQIPLIPRSKTMPQAQENRIKKLQRQNEEQNDLKRQNIFRKSIISHTHAKQIQPATAKIKHNLTSDQSKRDMINLKILNIDAKLTQPNFAAKFLKIQMNDQSPYFTQSSKQMFYLNWKGKGYIFFNCSQESKFVLSMFEQNQETTFSIGNCQISLSQLEPQLKKINKYEAYIINDRQECVGTIFIQYEFFQKNGNGLFSISPPLSRNKMEYHKSSPDSYRNKKFKLKLNKQPIQRDHKVYSLKNSAISESNIKSFKRQRSQTNESVNQRNSNSVEQHEKNPRSYSKNREDKSSLKIRKYNGGNIFISKADRFQPKVNQQVKIPGPGYYQYSSQFQRHASPI